MAELHYETTATLGHEFLVVLMMWSYYKVFSNKKPDPLNTRTRQQGGRINRLVVRQTSTEIPKQAETPKTINP